MSSIQQLFPTGNFGSVSSINSAVTGAATVGSLILPTSGGTATPLTYYEEYVNAAFTWVINGTGYTPTSATSAVSAVRVGSQVVVRIAAFSVPGNGAGTAGFFVSSSALPARFCPVASDYIGTQEALLNGGGKAAGFFQVNYLGSTGVIAAGLGTVSLGNFGNTNASPYGLGTDVCLAWSLI